MSSHVDAKPTHTRLTDLPSAFWWLWAVQLIVWIGRFVVPYMTIYLTKEVGMTATEAGYVLSGFGIGVVISALWGGVLADKIGRKKILVASELLSVVILVAIPFVEGKLAVAALLSIYGLFNGTAGPVISTIIGDLVAPQHRRTAFNYNYFAINFGYAIGPLAAGFMAEYSFASLFFAQAGLVTISVVFLMWKVPETKQDFSHIQVPENITDTQEPKANLWAVLKDRPFMVFVIVMFLYSIVYVQSTSTLPIVMTQQGHPSSYYGWLLALNGAVLCILQLPTARFLNRYSRDAIIVVAILVTGLGMGMQAFAQTLPFYLCAVLVWTIGEMGSHPQAQSMTADLADPRSRGKYQGVYGLTHSLATAVGPVLGGYALDLGGAGTLWFSSAALAVVSAAILLTTRKSRQERITYMLSKDSELRARQENLTRV